MANNGGTLNGVPQPPQRGTNNSCNTCGVTFDSSDSLQVHIHYHHTENSLNRWGQVTNNIPPNGNQTANNNNGGISSVANAASMPPTSNSPTDSENNNQPKHQQTQHHITQQKSASPVNFTISAAADSSDNQPPTPQSTASDQQQSTTNNRNSQGFAANGNNLPYQSHTPQHHHHQQTVEMHYPSYMTNYDQYYHQHSMEYGLPPPSHYLNNTLPPPQSQQEYKTVPSSNRFHPYSAHNNSLPTHPYHAHHHAHAHHHHHHQQQQSQSTPALVAAAAIVSAAAVQSAMSPRIVTSSSPIQNNLMHSTTVSSALVNAQQHIISGQPTPSPSPRQCDKCGLVCETITQLNEHHATVHSSANNSSSDSSINRSAGNGDIENEIPSFQYSNYGVKDEPECDILDLDSQKMVYPPHDINNQQGPLPPMHSLYPMQRSMMWPHASPHDPNSLLPIPPPSSAAHHAADLKPPMFGSMKNEFSPQIVKQELSGAHHLTQLPNPQSQSTPAQNDVAKSFVTDGNQLTTSPSEFPSTTTPQDNGSQFRTFEAATSSLPSGAPIMKSTSWKSNEARRPKTYNCTACNKWFTSSGHLKRHYNTTLHKNAVKSSGQPDPATLPISVHHHPARDPNSKHHRHNNNNSTHNNNSIAQQQQQQQQQAQQQQQSSLPSESPRTPDYSPQYTPSGLGFSQNHPTNSVGFQQYATQNTTQSNISIPPNAQAGLSVNVSQPRGLLNYSNITGSHNNQHIHHQSQLRQSSDQDFIQAQQIQQSPESTIININSMGQQQHYNTTTPITINTNITQLYPDIHQQQQHQNFTIIGNERNDLTTENMHLDNDSSPNDHEDVSDQSSLVQYYNSDGTILVSTSSASDLSNEENQEQSPYHIIKSEYYDDTYQNYQSMDEEKTNKNFASTTIPAISAFRRLNSDIYHADTVPPFSPDIPDKKIQTPYHKMYQDRSATPQTGEIVPAHLSPNAPSHQYADVPVSSASIVNEPSSPSVTSTNTTIGIEAPKEAVVKSKAKPMNKRRATVGAAAATTNLITATIPIGNDPLRCAPCDKVFNKACYLTQHNKTFHSGEKPYKCQRCGKRFPCDQTHGEHLAKHIGNKPFKCNQCTKQFNHKTDLRRHMCLHTGTKPYTCEICNKGFIRKDHMVKHGLTHLKRKHSDVIYVAGTGSKTTADGKQATIITNNSKASKRNANLNSKKRKKLNEIPSA